MASPRYQFGSGASDFAIAPPSRHGGFVVSAASLGNGTLWSASTGGTQYTDLQTVNGGATTKVSTDKDGSLVPFFGPAGVDSGWLDFGGGGRSFIAANRGVDAHVAGLIADAASATGAAAATVIASSAASAADAAMPAIMADTASLARVSLDAAYAPVASAASVDDLSQTILLTTGTITATTTIPLHVALGPVELEQLALAVTGSVVASDTNYWTVSLKTYRAGTSYPIGFKTTKVTAGEALTANLEWNFDLVSFDSTARILNKGDLLVVTLTPTGAPAALACPIITYRVSPSAGVTPPAPAVVTDSFDRPDAAALGTADSSQAWTTSTAWSIVSNRAQSTGVASGVINAGISDCTVQGTIVSHGTGTTGIIFRYSDTSNYWGVTNNFIFKRVAGAVTNLTTFTPSVGTGSVCSVVLSGSTITVLVGGVTAFTTTDSFNSTATMHGLRSSAAGGIVDDFKVTA